MNETEISNSDFKKRSKSTLKYLICFLKHVLVNSTFYRNRVAYVIKLFCTFNVHTWEKEDMYFCSGCFSPIRFRLSNTLTYFCNSWNVNNITGVCVWDCVGKKGKNGGWEEGWKICLKLKSRNTSWALCPLFVHKILQRTCKDMGNLTC